MARCCKTCRHLDVKPDSLGRIIVRGGDSCYPCIYPVPIPHLPDYITKSFGFSGDVFKAVTPRRRLMQGSDGTGCPTWEARKP